jgi:hypothetical protein
MEMQHMIYREVCHFKSSGEFRESHTINCFRTTVNYGQYHRVPLRKRKTRNRFEGDMEPGATGIGRGPSRQAGS